VRCEECGFDWDGPDAATIPDAVRDLGRRFTPPLTRFLPTDDADAVVRARPAEGVWSALEYAAHTRDALRFYEARIRRVLAEDRPQLESWGFAEVAERDRYNEQDPATVRSELAESATTLADLLAGLDDPAWARVGLGTDGDERTVLVLARRALHEGGHHLLDVGRSLRAARQR
jgi:hypothetical protein